VSNTSRLPSAPDLARLRADGITVLDEPTGKALIASIGITTPAGVIAASPSAAAEAAASLGGRCMLKAVSTNQPHKSEAGGVAGPFDDPADVQAAATVMARASFTPNLAFLVEPWIAGDAEVIMGLNFTSAFGPTLMFGVGGIWVEEYRDVAHRLAPVSLDEAKAMISSRRAVRTLTGGRGGKSTQIADLANAIRLFSRLATDRAILEHVAEIEINPAIVSAGAPVTAVDCTVVLHKPC
jgi:succinyl-CoA synthetase beta subunit